MFRYYKSVMDRIDLGELFDAMAGLSEIDRKVLYGSARGDDVDAIARELSRSRNAVYLILCRARKKLKNDAAFLLAE